MALFHPIEKINKKILNCESCPRLRKHCTQVAETKRKAFLKDHYWGKPVTGFGDLHARLMIVGLAPGAHGANRTGRIFTGDRSGDWLYRALFRAGFANQSQSLNKRDGLKLKDAYVSCIVRCAPPNNLPTPSEQSECLKYLKEEFALMPQIKVWMALGQLAFQRIWPLLKPPDLSRRPNFSHGMVIPLGDQKILILSYHPSQQNTFTGKLTESMFDHVFSQAKSHVEHTHE